MESMQSQFNKSRRLRQSVMRRVWYVFMLSIILRPALIMGAVLGASTIAFWRLVSITSIIENILSVKVGRLPAYTAEALLQADFLALTAFLCMMMVGVVVIFRLLLPVVSLLQMRATR